MGGVLRRQLANLTATAAMLITLAGLAFGLPALDRSLPAERPARTDRPYPVGAGVTVVPPPGATVDITQYRPGDNDGSVLFLIGGVRYLIVVEPFDGDLGAAAEHLRRKITGRVGYQVAGTELTVATMAGLPGTQGGYTAPGRGGRYAVFLAGGLAIEVTVSGDDMALARTLSTVEASTRTIRYEPTR
jgi:hypothetical protein